MRIEKKVALMGAAAAAMPWMSEAATLTYQFANIQVSTTGVNGTYTSAGGLLSGTPNAEVLTVAPFYYVKFGLQAEVTDNNGGGLFSFDVGLMDSGDAAVVIATSQAAGTQLANPGVSAIYDGAKTFGVSDGAGGISSAATGGVFGGFNPKFATLAQGANAAGVFSNLFTSEKIAVVSFIGTSTFTPVQINGGTGIMTQPAHTSGGSTAFYASRGFTPGLDTISALPTLKIVVVEQIPHSIISLTPGTAPVVVYDPADGSIAMTGNGHGSYNVAPATGFAEATTGSVLVSGFNPSTDQEIFALKLSQNGVAIPPSNTALLSAIASDINGDNGTISPAGVSASLIGGAFANLFPGYDLLITSTGTQPADAGGNSVLGFDFSDNAEFNPADAGITVTGVAAVPEPATALGAVLAATAFLQRRRKNRSNQIS